MLVDVVVAKLVDVDVVEVLDVLVLDVVEDEAEVLLELLKLVLVLLELALVDAIGAGG